MRYAIRTQPNDRGSFSAVCGEHRACELTAKAAAKHVACRMADSQGTWLRARDVQHCLWTQCKPGVVNTKHLDTANYFTVGERDQC